MKDIGKHKELKEKYGSFLLRLERVGNEISYDNNKLSRKMLLELINQDEYNLLKELERYIIVHYKDIKS